MIQLTNLSDLLFYLAQASRPLLMLKTLMIDENVILVVMYAVRAFVNVRTLEN